MIQNGVSKFNEVSSNGETVSTARPLPVTIVSGGGGGSTSDATAANQTTEITKLTSIDGKITVVNTGAVVISSSALPSGASTSALQTQPGVDIGDVTINNSTGASAVNIQDGGNSITVDGSLSTVSTITNVVHIDDNAGSLTVDGTVATTQSGTWTVQPGNTANTTAWKVDGSAVTQPVSNAGLTNIDVVLSTRLKPADTLTGLTTLGTITNVVHVDDNAGSLTVDGTVALGAGSAVIGHVINDASSAVIGHVITDTGSTTAVTGTITVDSELTTADLDTGAGTDTRAVVGIAGAASGGAVLVQATSGGALKADITTIAGTAPTTVGKLDVKAADGDVFVRQATGTNLHTVIDSGTLTTVSTVTAVTGITNVVHVDDNSGSLTVDYATTGSGTSTGALRVELPSNGTGVIATVGAVTSLTNALPAGTNAIGKLAANDGVDIGDVTINNATGASAVNVQDGGNSLTVDGSVTVTQATGTSLHAVIDSGSTTAVTQSIGTNLHTVLDSGTLSTITNVVHIDDNSGSITVDNTGTFAVQATGTITANGQASSTVSSPIYTEAAQSPLSQTLKGQLRISDDSQLDVISALQDILLELRVMNFVLNTTLNGRDDLDDLRKTGFTYLN